MAFPTLSRRLPLLLVFRATVASIILLLTLSADIFNWRIKVASYLLYSVAIGTYAVVLMLALLLRTQTSPVVLSTIHLVTSVIAAFAVVEGTGNVESAFTFLYLLIILDGAIVGGRHLAVIMATICTLVHGTQLALQLYGILPEAYISSQPQLFITSFITHLTAFYLTAFLAGQLASLWQHAEESAAIFETKLVAQEHMASLGQLSAAIAHEIRNPLAAISGSVELLVKSSEPATQEKLKTIILREIERLNTLIEEFLIYAKPMPPKLFPTDLCALTHEICDVIKTHEVAENHSIEVVGPARLDLAVDAAQIRQVLWNLLKNALEASPHSAPVKVILTGNSREVCIAIKDAGQGIPPEIQKVLFQPFFTTKAEGTGLGLAVVKRIIEGHKGDIEFTYENSVGTTACIKLPVSFSV